MTVMKQRKIVIVIIGVLILFTIILAAVYNHTRDNVPEGTFAVIQNGQTKYIRLEQLSLSDVTGTVVNGKGEEKQIDARGLPLSSVTGTEGFQMVTVTAMDAYSAIVSLDELENAYLILTDDGTLRLIVFGDNNSKRDVKDVERIEIE